MKINLWQNWFDSDVRPQEFEYCREKNLKIFDSVHYLGGRPTFATFFKRMAQFPDDVNILANLDIYFDESVEMCKWVQRKQAYCLTRWEDDGMGNVISFKEKHHGHPGEWSQDAWVFTGDEIKWIKADFYLGQRGCDNRIARILAENDFEILNPSLDIRAIHVHNYDTDASYRRGEKVKGDYLPVKPDKLKMI